ncbi:sensor histidine kinase [Streptomyces sp. NPDC051286]|uniref:sensor histidine kinase n=1 Tax=Streptomyces sp. NPDC051286 TaxID=3365647 RepID=UPI00378D3B77
MEHKYPHRGPVWMEWLLAGGVLLLVAQGLAKARFEVQLFSVGPIVAVAAALLLPLRWRSPLAVVLLAGAALGAQGAYEPMTVMVFHLTAQGRVRVAVAAGVIAGALPWVCAPPLSGGVTPNYGAALLFALALTAGLWWHSRRRLIDSLSEQVELRAEQARSAERARIAAEMHDVLAHRLSLLALHTGVLALRAESLPPQIGERIALLRTTSAQALADLRDVLGALRAEDDAVWEAGRNPMQSKVPAPALRNLSELLDEVRSIGQDVAAELTGEPGAAPATHLLAVHRLVQEGLTNARKHAPGTAVRLRVHYGAPATEVELVNSPPAVTASRPDGGVGQGFGLIGLAERVAGLHGSLAHGPEPDGGWRLAARLPMSAPDGEPSRRAFEENGTTRAAGPVGGRAGGTVGKGVAKAMCKGVAKRIGMRSVNRSGQT